MITKKQAHRLAVAYHAFQADSRFVDGEYVNPNGVRVWGRILLEVQDQTGVETIKPNVINSLMECSKGMEQ